MYMYVQYSMNNKVYNGAFWNTTFNSHMPRVQERRASHFENRCFMSIEGKILSVHVQEQS